MPAEDRTEAQSKVASNGAKNGKSGRPSALMRVASTISTGHNVESSLDDFISRANETLLDMDGWGIAEAEEKARKAERAAHEADKAAAIELVEVQTRREALAEASKEQAVLAARVAELEKQLEAAAKAADKAQSKADKAESKAESKAAKAKSEVAASATTTIEQHPDAQFLEDQLAKAKSHAKKAESRARTAEAKATKALAAARAAVQGIRVDPADLDDIEEGLGAVSATPVEEPTAKKFPIGLLAAAFVGGLVIMFGVTKIMGGGDKDTAKNDSPPPIAAQAGQPVNQDTSSTAVRSALPVEPALTPVAVDDKTAADDLADQDTLNNAADPADGALDTPEPIADVVEPAPAVVKQPVADASKQPAKAAKTEPKTPVKKTANSAANPAKKAGIVDPFGAPAAKKTTAKPAPKKVDPKPAPKKTAPKKKTTGIVDPFAQ